MNIDDQPKIRVVVRKRPLNKKELIRSEHDVIDVRNGSSVIVRQMKQKVDLTKYIDEHHFNFDRAFCQTSTNQEVYEDCVRPIVHCAFQGARVTCFAYGQTGSGKTYTMNGDAAQKVQGLYVLGAQDIFRLRDSKFTGLTVTMSFYQIYCGKLFDLLNNREQLQAREDAKQNVNIVGLAERNIGNVAEFMQVVSEGAQLRITSQNSTNADSSRSHAILQIFLYDGKKLSGKMSFIDLAGCERGADTIDMSKQTRIDGAEINKSLLALKECIRALDNGKAHTPFRGSKLTMVLKDSLTGFCRTVMIGNISPNSGSCENTLNTLRYADRVKELKKHGGESTSKEDQLARELMLPRMLKNRQTVEFNDSDQESPTSYIGAKSREHEGVRSTRDRQGLQNRKKSVLKDDHANSRLKEERRGYSANPKNIIGRQSKVSSRPQQMVQSTQVVQTNNAPRQPKILSQYKPLPKQGFQTEGVHSCSRQEVRTEVSQNFSKVELTTEPSKPKLIDQQKVPKAFLKKQQPTGIHNSQYIEWENMLTRFRKWQPESEEEVHNMSERFQGLVNLIMRQEEEVLEMHKTEMDVHTEIQQHQQRLYKEIMQEDNSNQEFLSYADNLEELVEMKISTLVNLRSKLQSYKYHLTEHEICEKKLIKASQQFIRRHQDIILMDMDDPPISVSLPQLPSSPRLFQNSSQYNITQSVRPHPCSPQFLSSYNSNITTKQGKNVQHQKSPFNRSTMQTGVSSMGNDTY